MDEGERNVRLQDLRTAQVSRGVGRSLQLEARQRGRELEVGVAAKQRDRSSEPRGVCRKPGESQRDGAGHRAASELVQA